MSHQPFSFDTHFQKSHYQDLETHSQNRKKKLNSSKGMEGLIPMLVHALKKQKPHHSFRCLSEGSNRSYHMLIGPQDSVHGSSHHRRTRSEFKPSTADHFLDQRFAPEFSHSNSFNNTNGTRQIGSGTYQVRKETKSYLGRWKNN